MPEHDPAQLMRLITEEIWNRRRLELVDELIAEDLVDHRRHTFGASLRAPARGSAARLVRLLPRPEADAALRPVARPPRH